MSGETISAAIITIASVICAAGFVAAVTPSILSAGDPVVSSTNVLKDQIDTNIKIIHAASNPEGTEVYIWIKNVGDNRISSNLVDNSDLFFGESGNFMRVPYDETGTEVPGWRYSIENSGVGQWQKGDTIRITVRTSVSSGNEYFIKFITYNGVSDEDYFAVS